MRRVLVEPSAHHLLNAGDTAMLRIATTRIRELWPEAAVGVITEDPERLAAACPGTVPVSATARTACLEEPILGARTHRSLPRYSSVRLRRMERSLQARFPTTATTLVRMRRKLKGADNTAVVQFLEWTRTSDVVVVSGAGLFDDAFAPRAISVLCLVDAALRHGAVAALMGQGVSRFTDPELEHIARRVLPRVHLIGLREESTGRAVLGELGVPDSTMVATGDDAVELAYAARNDTPDGKGLGVAIRVARYSGVGERLLGTVSRVLEEMSASRGAPLVPIPISAAANEKDREHLERLLGSGGAPARRDSVERDPVEIVRHCHVVIAGSYHAALFALAQGIPAVGLAANDYYVQKFEGLAEQFDGLCPFVRLDRPSAEVDLRHAAEDAWESAEEIKTKLLAAAERQVRAGRDAYHRLSLIAPAGTRVPHRSAPRSSRATHSRGRGGGTGGRKGP